MSNTHRLVWIEGQILAQCYPSASTIAAHFEISRRQAARDLEYMRDSLGAPLEYCYTHRGYYYSCEGFTLPGVHMTTEQRDALKRLSRAYEHLPEEHARNMADLFRRISEVHKGRRPQPASMPEDIPWLTGAPLNANVVISFSAPDMVDFSAIEVLDIKEGGYTLKALDFRQLLLFLLACPCEFTVISPSWMKLRLRTVLQKTLQSLSH